MAEGFMIQVVGWLISLARRVIMSIFINWWRNKTIAHISTTVTHERMKIKAQFDGRIPHLAISWTTVNRSYVDIAIKRVAGEIYVGAWRVALFDSDRILESHVGYTWSPLVAVKKLVVPKKGGESGITVTVFPSLEFWVMNVSPFKCSLYNCTIDVLFRGGFTTLKVPSGDNIPIEDFESVASRYLDTVRNVVKEKT